jgi:serine/threonine protein kinase
MLTLPNYQITSQIYESVNSLVYRGIRKQDNQPVILKMLKQDYPTPAELTRYRQEYEIIHHLDLTGVIKAYTVEKWQNTLVIILEDFGGESLKQLIENQTFLVKAFLPIAIQITDILGHIHAANIIHKDINPSNIVVNLETKTLKIIDFGIASRLPRENPTLKNPEQLEGTLAYLSPEQTGRINRSMDYRTDLYSLGVTCYEMLTGFPPFEATEAMELVHCHIAKPPISVNQLNAKVPPIVSDIVMKLLSKNAEDRYQSAFGVKADFEKCQENLEYSQNLNSLQFALGQNDFSGHFQIRYFEEILLNLRPKLKQTQHQIKIQGDDNLSLNSYPGTFSQIITNLVMNSLIHAYKKNDAGTIRINYRTEAEQVILQYQDDGKGMPPEILTNVFDPFFTTNRGQGGTGLGLHIVYNLVTQKLNGEISVESQVGQGTTFLIELPL